MLPRARRDRGPLGKVFKKGASGEGTAAKVLWLCCYSCYEGLLVPRCYEKRGLCYSTRCEGLAVPRSYKGATGCATRVETQASVLSSIEILNRKLKAVTCLRPKSPTGARGETEDEPGPRGAHSESFG